MPYDLQSFSHVCPSLTTLQEDQTLLTALEASSEEALGSRTWMSRLDPDFLDNLGRYRKYRHNCLRDLLRVIRNKHNHFRELPDNLQQKLGPIPEGFLKWAAATTGLLRSDRYPQYAATA